MAGESTPQTMTERPGATWPRFERRLGLRNRFMGEAWEGAVEAPSHVSDVPGRGRPDQESRGEP